MVVGVKVVGFKGGVDVGGFKVVGLEDGVIVGCISEDAAPEEVASYEGTSRVVERGQGSPAMDASRLFSMRLNGCEANRSSKWLRTCKGLDREKCIDVRSKRLTSGVKKQNIKV